MDQVALQARAVELQKLLRNYASADTEAALFYSAIQDHLVDAQSGAILAPLRWRQLPGRMYLQEGSLQKYRDLETAYYKFAVEVTGGVTPALRQLNGETTPPPRSPLF